MKLLGVVILVAAGIVAVEIVGNHLAKKIGVV